MKSITRIIILLLISLSFIKCNVIKTDNNNNVAFIYFTNTNSSYKKTNTYYYKKTKIVYNHYIFQFDDNVFNDVMFYHKKYKNFDNQNKNLKMLNFEINKSFLRKNKNSILNSDKIRAMGKIKFLRLLYKVDMVFLIDEDMIRNNKITVMEMTFNHTREE